jgi:hypothetical protein
VPGACHDRAQSVPRAAKMENQLGNVEAACEIKM